MPSFTDVIEARAAGPQALNEASLGRVLQHVEGGKSWGILTSWRQGLPKTENDKRLAELQHRLRSAQLGYFRLLGHWKEEGQPKATKEPSLFVPEISRDLIIKLGKDYEQDAVLYCGPDTNGEITLLFGSGKEQSVGKFNPGKIAQAYSSIRGKTFTFECFEYPAQTFIENIIERHHSKHS